MRGYDEEFKRGAVKKIHDGQSVASVARELGVAESLLHNWKRQAVATSSDVEREVIALRKKLREVEMERDHIKKGSAYLQQERLVRYRFINAEKRTSPVRLLCRVMRVSPSSFQLYASGKSYVLSSVKATLATQVEPALQQRLLC